MDNNGDRNEMSQGRYDARRAAALVLVVGVLVALAIGLVLSAGHGENPRSGMRVQAPDGPATAPN